MDFAAMHSRNRIRTQGYVGEQLLNYRPGQGKAMHLAGGFGRVSRIANLILELIHTPKPDFAGGLCFLDTEPTQALPGHVSHGCCSRG